jgi:Rad51
MQTRRAVEPLQPKTWQLDPPSSGLEGYLYHCLLCDEALVLSRQEINPRKILLVFDDTCPGCGFQLQSVLGCRASILPGGRRLLTSLSCRAPEVFLEPEVPLEKPPQKGSTLSRGPHPDLTTGMEHIDKKLVLKRGQLTYLHGEQSHSLSLLFSVRATLPPPHGLDSDVVFIDAGNLFDSYAITQHSLILGLGGVNVEQRIHLSRAFTHHQVFSLIMDKLAPAVEEHRAGLAVVSDITALFCDPDVRDKKESLDIFRKSLHFLAQTAQQRNMIIIVTNIKARNKVMEDDLNRTAHFSIRLMENETHMDTEVARYPFYQGKTGSVIMDNGTLHGYFR